MTKHIKWMSAVLLAALIAVPAFAQTEKQTVSKVAKAVEQAALKARQKAQQKICAYCGEEITERYQHCSAQGYAGICSPTKNDCKAPKSSAPASHCPKCGEELTIDERYHGVEHHCKDNAQTTAQKPVCAYCGEEITSQGQHCSAQNYISLCSKSKKHQRKVKSETPASRCPKCGKKLTIDERYHGATHICKNNTSKEVPCSVCAYCGKKITAPGQHCSAKGYVGLCSEEKTQAKQPSSSWAPTHCDKCGEELTIDERHHGAEHHCNSAAEQQTKYCIYCGEEIKTSGQSCPSSECGVKCTVSCPDCGADLRDPANLSADGVHHCRFKQRIKPVPIKK